MIYTGEIENGQLHGKGKITYANGEKYEVDPDETTLLRLRCSLSLSGYVDFWQTPRVR